MTTVYAKVSAYLATRNNEEKAATAVEYALVIGLVSIVLVGALVAFKGPLTDFVNGISFGNGNK